MELLLIAPLPRFDTLRATLRLGFPRLSLAFRRCLHRERFARTERVGDAVNSGEAVKCADSALTLLGKNGWYRGAALMIRSSGWQAMIAAVVVTVLCLTPGAKAGGTGRDSPTVDPGQSTAPCRSDCAVGKQSLVTLSGVDTTKVGDMVVRDSQGRYAAIANGFREILLFDATGKLLDSPRLSFGRIVSLFVDSERAVRTYDIGSGSLLTFDSNYKVTAQTELPHRPALLLGGDRSVVASQITTPALVGYPLHLMSKDGRIEKSFGADGGPFREADVFKNVRAVCLNPDGTIWSIAAGGRLLERWDTSTGRRVAQVTVKSTWFRESSRPAPQTQVANPYIVTIWADKDLIWILYQVPDPHWVPRKLPEEDLVGTGEMAERRSDWVLEAVRSDTGNVIAMKSFDRILRRRDGSIAIASDMASANRGGGVELWKPVVVKKEKKQ